MSNTTIYSGIKNILMLDQIIECSSNVLKAWSKSGLQTIMEHIEASAQTASFHMKKRLNFEMHTFLLKVSSFSKNSENKKNYRLLLTANLLASSNQTALYNVKTEEDGRSISNGMFLIGTVPFDKQYFKKEHLLGHYKRTYQCLLNATERE